MQWSSQQRQLLHEETRLLAAAAGQLYSGYALCTHHVQYASKNITHLNMLVSLPYTFIALNAWLKLYLAINHSVSELSILKAHGSQVT